MARQEALLRLLADGRFHSGDALGRALGVGRGAVWRHVRALADLGVEVFGVRGKGYRLAAPLELLERDAILDALSARARTRLDGLDVLGLVASTNALLAARAAADYRGPRACLAEGQSAGRGRRGRAWASPYGRNLYLSLLCRFERPRAGLQSLGLAIGVVVAEVLAAAGVREIGLKWPNDLVWHGHKLGGILIEMSGAPEGPWDVVAGIGVNVEMPVDAVRDLDQAWTDVRRVARRRVSRNTLAAGLIDGLIDGCDGFERHGFAPFRTRFDALDAVRGREVSVEVGTDERLLGRARGIDDDGALLVEVAGESKRILGGDVTLRMAT